jgi:ribonucleotide monophosphatase NagD (HAD superfamily)
MATIIVDIDGTLLRAGSTPMRRTIDYINEQAKTHRIVVVTGRPSSQRAATAAALRRAGVRYNALRMAPVSANTHEKRIEYKRQVGQDLRSEAVLAIDNDEDARRVYSSAGIPTKSPGSLPEVRKWASSAFDLKIFRR